jgi:hypothetical protein
VQDGFSVTEKPAPCMGDATLVCPHRRLTRSMAMPNSLP